MAQKILGTEAIAKIIQNFVIKIVSRLSVSASVSTVKSGWLIAHEKNTPNPSITRYRPNEKAPFFVGIVKAARNIGDKNKNCILKLSNVSIGG
jgi:hypothetical protein